MRNGKPTPRRRKRPMTVTELPCGCSIDHGKMNATQRYQYAMGYCPKCAEQFHESVIHIGATATQED